MGLIQSFEFTFELAWNLMKDYLHDNGIFDIVGSKGAIRSAFKNGVIENGAVWMDMIERRNETSHTYEEEIAIKVVDDVSNAYIDEMRKLLEKMREYEAMESKEEKKTEAEK